MFDLKVGLGIGFDRFNRDLRKAADQIEDLGKSHSIKLGAVAGDVASGKFDPQQINNAVTMAGTRLAVGMAEGIRRSSALMLGFVARVNVMLDRLVGSAVTIFRRIDAAMKFPAFDRFFKTAQLRLSNFSALWRKPLSDVDVAIQGGFGGAFQRVTKIVKALVDDLAAHIARALKEAVAQVAAEFARVAANAGHATASAQGLFTATQRAAQAGAQFPQFGPIGGRQRGPGFGRRLGASTNFMAPGPPVGAAPTSRWAEAAKTFGQDVGVGVRAATDTLATFGSVIGKVGAALVSVPLRAYVPFARLKNFLSALGDVGKRSFRQIYEQHGLLVGTILAATKTVTGLGTAILRVGTLGVFGKATKDAQGLDRSVKTTTAAVGRLSGVVRRLGTEILAAFGVVGVIYKAVQFLVGGVKAASDLNETAAQAKVIFGSSYGHVEAQVKRLNKQFGISRREQLDVASGFGAMAQAAGYTEAAAAGLANQLTKVTAQFAASENVPFAEAADKVRSGLAGAARSLRENGAWLDEDTVKSYALAHGMAASADAITRQAKLAARAAIIMRDLSYTQGALERSATTAAGEFRKAGGGIEEFGLRIGQLLLPAVKLGTEAFNALLGAILDVFEGSAPTIEAWAGAIGAAMENVGKFVRNFGLYWQVAQLRVGEFVVNTIAWIETIPKNWGPMTEWLGRNWFNLLVDLGNAARVAFTNLLDNAVRFGEALWKALRGEGFEFQWKGLLDGFKATTERLPELIKPDLISVNDEVNRIFGEIERNERRFRRATTPPPGKKSYEQEAMKTPEHRLASAVEITSKEAYSTFAKSQTPVQRVANQQLAVARRQQQNLQQIQQNTAQGAAARRQAVAVVIG